jgi:DNA-binding NtrC family response regulator
VGWLELARGPALVLCDVEKLPMVNQRQLRRHRYRRSETAQFLGLSRKTLYNKVCAYELYPESAKSDRS